jgi:L-cysteine/cystine lyase
MDIADIRRLAPAVENCAYYQTSGFPPKLEPVIDESARWMRFQNQGPALSWVSQEMDRQLEKSRARVAANLNVDADEIMLNENTTVGINIVAYGINWKAGDNVVLSDHEHPGNRIVWYHLATRFDVELRFLRVTNDATRLVEDLEALIDGRTRLVSISHVSRQSGLRLPARQLVDAAHRHATPVLLDGAQAFGAIPVDVRELNCDFYTCSGHKYIMGPQATGIFFVRRDMLEWLKPSWIGSHSQEEMDNDGGLVLKKSARRFEFGTRNIADLAGLNKALQIWEEIGWEKVYRRIAEYTDYMKRRLLEVPALELFTPVPYARSSGIVTYRIPGVSASPQCRSLMEHERILVAPAGPDDESIRVSTHVFNTEEECDRLVAGLMRIVEKGY